MAQRKGYKPGWVSNQYREKYGVWPNDPRVSNAPALEPGKMLSGWLRHLRIKERSRHAS